MANLRAVFNTLSKDENGEASTAELVAALVDEIIIQGELMIYQHAYMYSLKLTEAYAVKSALLVPLGIVEQDDH